MVKINQIKCKRYNNELQQLGEDCKIKMTFEEGQRACCLPEILGQGSSDS